MMPILSSNLRFEQILPSSCPLKTGCILAISACVVGLFLALAAHNILPMHANAISQMGLLGKGLSYGILLVGVVGTCITLYKLHNQKFSTTLAAAKRNNASSMDYFIKSADLATKSEEWTALFSAFVSFKKASSDLDPDDVSTVAIRIAENAFQEQNYARAADAIEMAQVIEEEHLILATVSNINISNYDKAFAYIQKIERKNPRYFNEYSAIYIRLAEHAYKNNDFQCAIDYFEKAKKMGEFCTEQALTLNRCYFKLHLKNGETTQDLAAKIGFTGRAISFILTSEDRMLLKSLYITYGEQAQKIENYELAIHCFERAKEMAALSQAHTQTLNRCYFSYYVKKVETTQILAEKIEHTNSAYRLMVTPEDRKLISRLYIEIGTHAEKIENFQRAIYCFENATGLEPLTKEQVLILKRCHFNEHLKKGAFERAREGITTQEDAKKFIHAIYNAADRAFNLKNFEEVETYLSIAAPIANNQTPNFLGKIHFKLGHVYWQRYNGFGGYFSKANATKAQDHFKKAFTICTFDVFQEAFTLDFLHIRKECLEMASRLQNDDLRKAALALIAMKPAKNTSLFALKETKDAFALFLETITKLMRDPTKHANALVLIDEAIRIRGDLRSLFTEHQEVIERTLPPTFKEQKNKDGEVFLVADKREVKEKQVIHVLRCKIDNLMTVNYQFINVGESKNFVEESKVEESKNFVEGGKKYVNGAKQINIRNHQFACDVGARLHLYRAQLIENRATFDELLLDYRTAWQLEQNNLYGVAALFMKEDLGNIQNELDFYKQHFQRANSLA